MKASASVGLASAFLVAGCQSGPSQRSEATSPQAVPPETAVEVSSPGSSSTSVVVPELLGRVNEYAELLTPDEEAELAALYRSLEQEIGSQMVLLTIVSLHGVTMEDYSLTVANAWGLGRRDVDDGLLITLAREERTIRLEVGLGLEVLISDEASRRVLSHMAQEYREGRFFAGLRLGSRELVQMIRANPELVGTRKP